MTEIAGAASAGQSSVERPVLPIRALQAVAGLFLALKLVVLASAGIFVDEAYYWIWGQHPALSYYDHPPLSAWLQGLSSLIFGWDVAGVRAMVLLALLGDIFVLWLFARRLPAAQRQSYFWITLVVFLATPMFFSATGFALPDHLLVLCCLASIYGFTRFFESRSGSDAGAYRWLYLGALFLGLAGLCKYNAALLGVGITAYVVGSAATRPLLRNPQLYLAALLAIVMQAPVLIWNIETHFASFSFLVGNEHFIADNGYSPMISVNGVLGYIGGAVVFLSPFLLVPLYRYVFAPADHGDGAAGLGRAVFIVSTLAIFAAALRTNVLFHWNLIAYLAFLPFIAPWLRTRWLVWAQIIYGLTFAILVAINFSVVPVLAPVGKADQTSSWSYGWDEVAAHVLAAKQAHNAQFIAATNFSIAGCLAFALKDANVTSLNSVMDQFDFWFVPEDHAGEDAIFIADPHWRPLNDAFRARFASVTLLETLPIMRLGFHIGDEEIYLGQGFSGKAIYDIPRTVLPAAAKPS